MTQRIRVTYRKDGAARYVAHLDLMRTWERSIRRARLPLAYTQGFSPHARLQLAAPLPVGTAGERELLDLWLDRPTALEEVASRLGGALPPGLEVVGVEEVGDRLPALQAATVAARYLVRFAPGDLERGAAREAVGRLLALERLDFEEARGDKVRRYDLRRTVLELAACEDEGGGVCLEMRLALEPAMTGRPTSVVAALGIAAEPARVVRTGIELRAEGEAAAAAGEALEGDELEDDS